MPATSTIGRVMPPVVAGTFYPATSEALRASVHTLLSRAARVEARPRALVVPHAGYRYSGAVAATAYRTLESLREVRRVVLLGPSHRVAFRGIAAASCSAFATPLGEVAVDQDALAIALQQGGVQSLDAAFSQEHSVEVHLPFLQSVLPGCPVLPLVVGDAPASMVAQLLRALWTNDTLVVVSSDLSHFLDYDTAQAIDQLTATRIETLSETRLESTDACGCRPLNGLLAVARERGLGAHRVDLRNSGDTHGSADRVVGYGAWLLCETDATPRPAVALSPDEERTLGRIAREAIHATVHGAAAPDSSALPGDGELGEVRGCFVTLRRGTKLRGCIGQTQPQLPLAQAVAYCARQASSADPRFAPLTAAEAETLDVHVAVLGPLAEFPVSTEADISHSVRPGIDGLVINAGGRQATFLPSVWEQLRPAPQFVRALYRKAGATPGESGELKAWRYQVVDFDAPG